VRLHVAKRNNRAAALYERLGFRVIEELTQHRLMEYAVPPPEPGPTGA
jgi:ribosomal protein S18 acetylase RimI-like enzyme